MSDDIKKSIDELNLKQDEQTEKLINLSETSVKHSVFLDLYGKNLETIDLSLKEINKSLNTTNVILNKQEINLEEHMRRSLANEEAVDLLKQEMRPVEKHVHFVNTLAKVIVGVLSIAGAIIGIIKALNL